MCDMSKNEFPKGVETKHDRMNYICTQMIDPQALDIETINDCMVDEYFCDVCCNFNIGPADEVGRESCVKTCSTNFKDKETNRFELIYILELNTNVLKSYLKFEKTENGKKSLESFLEAVDASTDPEEKARIAKPG